MLGNAFTAPCWHAVNQFPDGCPWYCPPFLLESCTKLDQVGGSWVPGVHPSTKNVPEMFNWGQVWGLRGPDQCLDTFLSEISGDNSGPMWSGIIILEFKISADNSSQWSHNRTQYLVNVSLTSHGSVNDDQI